MFPIFRCFFIFTHHLLGPSSASYVFRIRDMIGIFF